jgi:hypothetical protein
LTTVFDIDNYIATLKTKYNIADEDLAAVPEIKAGFKRQDEFSRYQQEHKNAMTAVQAKYAELTEYENSIRALEQTYGPREQWSQSFAAAIAAQNPDGSNRMTPSGLTEADVDRRVAAMLEKKEQEFATRLETVGRGAAEFSKFYYKANKDWEKQYGSELPEEEFQKFFTDNGHTDPRIALALFEQPYKEKKREEEWQKKLEEADRAGEVRGRSQAGTPDGLSSGGGWMGESNISIGHAANTAANATDAAAGLMTRDQQMAKFNAGMEKRAQATGNFQQESK